VGDWPKENAPGLDYSQFQTIGSQQWKSLDRVDLNCYKEHSSARAIPVTDPIQREDRESLAHSQTAKRRLDGLVVNIELTLTSIIQGVALYFLTDNARVPLSQLHFEYWIYVANGLLLLFVFWSRSVVHTLTVIQWPIEFSHNFLYIACTLIEAIAFTNVQDPFLWYVFNALFACAVWILFIADSRMILRQQTRATELGSRIMSDQRMNIRFVMPVFILAPLIVALLIVAWPNVFLAGRMHVFFGILQFLILLVYLVCVLRFFAQLANLMPREGCDR
jgi:hypothetical protein